MSPSVAIVGGGFSGIAQARILSRLGVDFVVYESAPDVGGVWSSTRSYPGLRTQNPSSTYYLSEMPWAKGSSDFPEGHEVQQYLETYADHFGLMPRIELNTEVVDASQNADNSWTLTLRHKVASTSTQRTFDHLIVASGVFQEAFIPLFNGAEDFRQSGGEILHSSALLDTQTCREKDVIVVGYGKSAVDVATAVSSVAKSTTVVARALTWKLPRFLAKVLPYQYLLLTRVGEALFLFHAPGPVSKVLNGPLKLVRETMLGTLEYITKTQLGLKGNDLLPALKFETIACAQISLATEGFFERVKEGKIRVKRDCAIDRIERDGPGRRVVFSDGTTQPVDIILCGTGFQQKISFLAPEVMRKLTDKQGNFLLYRQIQPLEVQNLWFCGYNSSLFCPTSSEVASLWIACAIEGTFELPPVAERRKTSEEFFAWLDERSRGHHAHGTNVVPFSLATIDVLLNDIGGVKLSFPQYMREWLLPVSPKAYAAVADGVVEKVERHRKSA